MAQETHSLTSKNRRAFVRRRPRGKIKVSCFKGDLDLGENLAAGLADIAECGVLLLLKASVDRGQAVTLLPGRPRAYASRPGSWQRGLVRANGKGNLPGRRAAG